MPLHPIDTGFIVGNANAGLQALASGFVRTAAAAGFLTPVYIASTTSTNTNGTITAMASINAGDLLILVDRADGGPTPIDVVPTGFTSAGASISSAFTRGRMSYKIAVGNEDSSTITGMADDTVRKCLLQYRAESAIASLSLGTQVGEVTDDNPAQQTMTVSALSAPVIGVTAFISNSIVDPRTTSITPDQEIQIESGQGYVHSYIQESSPANYTFDMDDEGVAQCLIGQAFHGFL